MSGAQYLNIFLGSLETPHVSYLYDCPSRKCTPSSNIIAQAIDDSVRNLGINRSFFCLLLSDATKYMTAAGITLKSMYPKMFHVTCVAHLLHNCAMKVKSHFEDVDQLIAKVKAVTIKNKTRQAKFSAIGYPPQPVPTTWGKLVKCCLVLHKKFARSQDISLTVYHMLQNSQPTSASVERSFSMLKTLLAKDRNSKVIT